MVWGVLALLVISGGAAADAPDPPASGPPLAADTEQALDLSWWSVDGGGAASAGGTYSLTGAIGQPDVGASSRAYYALDAGVWSVELEAAFFYDGFENGDTGAWSAVAGGN